MNLAFTIQPPTIDTDKADLYLEINAQGLSYIILDNAALIALVVYHFDAGVSDETVAGNIHQVLADQPVLQQTFKQVHIIYSYHSAILVPEQFMKEADNNALLELVYGDVSERITRTDFIEKHSIYNIYGIPAVIELVVTRYFESATYAHLFSLLPCLVADSGNHLFCIFSSGQLKVQLIKDGKLQAMQNYTYKTQEDVAYYLLNLCNSFTVNVSNVILHLSGMIEADSPLYAELYKYFLQLQFEGLPDKFTYPDEIRQYPVHYFSHLFEIAACE